MAKLSDYVQSKAGKTVWILGSGFSKSLGGPLLFDLLSHRGSAFQRVKFSGERTKVYALYWRHLRGAPENSGYPVYWDHAEEFLEFIGSARVDNPRYTLLTEALHAFATTPNISEFIADAHKCVAADCLFTSHATLTDEAWTPYERWPQNIGDDHTIITFNYDVVLEMLGEHLKGGSKFGPSSVVAPSGSTDVGQNMALMRQANQVPILKLHGSVNWFAAATGFEIVGPSDAAGQLLDGRCPMIATPGPDKARYQEQRFAPLWDAAVEALKEAKVIVFLGYRFPQSDSKSRGTLLGAIRDNENDFVRVHTVLGPRTEDEHTVRLKKLLEHTLSSAPRRNIEEKSNSASPTKAFEIISHPLYVEDFLTVLHPKLLYGRFTGVL